MVGGDQRAESLTGTKKPWAESISWGRHATAQIEITLMFWLCSASVTSAWNTNGSAHAQQRLPFGAIARSILFRNYQLHRSTSRIDLAKPVTAISHRNSLSYDCLSCRIPNSSCLSALSEIPDRSDETQQPPCDQTTFWKHTVSTTNCGANVPNTSRI